MSSAWRRVAIVVLASMALFVVAGCGGDDSDSSEGSTTAESSGTPEIGVDDLTADFSAMAWAMWPGVSMEM